MVNTIKTVDVPCRGILVYQRVLFIFWGSKSKNVRVNLTICGKWTECPTPKTGTPMDRASSKKHSFPITLPETNSSHLKIDLPKGNAIFQPAIFRCYVSFREGSQTRCFFLREFLLASIEETTSVILQTESEGGF